MIVVDIETSGIYPEKHGIWQIGALDLFNPENTFLEEARIDDEDEIAEGALKVTGKTESQLRDKTKHPQKKLLENFFDWTETIKMKNCLCQNPQFDLGFMTYKARKYALKVPFHYRAFDLHSFASQRHYQFNRKFLLEQNHSGMGLSNTLKLCGLQDNREAHNALEDAKLTAECFSRIVFKKSLLPQYSKYKLPSYLAK